MCTLAALRPPERATGRGPVGRLNRVPTDSSIAEEERQTSGAPLLRSSVTPDPSAGGRERLLACASVAVAVALQLMEPFEQGACLVDAAA